MCVEVFVWIGGHLYWVAFLIWRRVLACGWLIVKKQVKDFYLSSQILFHLVVSHAPTSTHNTYRKRVLPLEQEVIVVPSFALLHLLFRSVQLPCQPFHFVTPLHLTQIYDVGPQLLQHARNPLCGSCSDRDTVGWSAALLARKKSRSRLASNQVS